MSVEILCNRSPWGNGIEVLIVDRNLNEIHVAEKITFKNEKIDKSIIQDPSFKMNMESAQKLMNHLFECGLRPSEDGSVGQLASIKYHLEDMRRLVFKNKIGG